MYERLSAHGVAVETVPLNDQFALNVAANQQAAADQKRLKILFICNPNNPTGNLMAVSDIIRIAEALGVIRHSSSLTRRILSTLRLTPCFRCLLTIPIW